ncbi:MAG: pyruvate ferredoxin oxidoreductase [Candidatus Moranbacteria bacterium RIFCSPHIGHO2_02_FULL_40_12b]|nr:MAG: pyruvate ferredoxin oxidoreductase [Candidatus Moranbacteria bacterium RIFCSPHIGHO2_02_FULL_40_12b]
MNNNKTKNKALTGGAAMAEAFRQINPDVMPVYPITPQTPIIETFAKFQAERIVETEIIPVESEHSAMSACVGSSAAGARTVTATSSQGLALMNEVLYIASGLRLPILMAVSARALSAPINIHGEHGDVMGARDTGWIQIFSENVQEAYDNVIIGLKLAEKTMLPIMVIMDGFITSHSVENLEILTDEKVKSFAGEYKPEKFLLNLEDPVTFGPVGLPNSYFEFKIDQGKAMERVFDMYKKITGDFHTISLRNYDLLEKYKSDDAEQIIVIAGSAAGTAKEVVDKLRNEGKKVGLVKIKLFRPFPHKEIAEALKNSKSVAVLDRAMSFGTTPPLYSEIVNSLHGTYYELLITSYVYGLGGRDIFQKNIEKVFNDMINGRYIEEEKYLNSK